MFSYARTARMLGAGVALLASLSAGCRMLHRESECSSCAKDVVAKSACTPCEKKAKPAKADCTVCEKGKPAKGDCVPCMDGKPAKVEIKSLAGRAGAGRRTISSPVEMPTSSIPPVSNERYINPAPAAPSLPAAKTPTIEVTPNVVTAEKPKIQLLPPAPTGPAVPVETVVIPPVGNTGIASRRSYADITAKPEYSHASDYTWLVGELHFYPQKNQWRLRYASIDNEDKYGGSVTLEAQQQLKDLQSGQMVRVEGEMIDAESRDASPRYRVKDVIPLKK